jgi:hypothetical protein
MSDQTFQRHIFTSIYYSKSLIRRL